MSTALLLNERFVAVFPSLVRTLGALADAAVLQEIHYQLQTGGKESDGHRWVPATVRDLSDAIGLSPDAVTRTTKRLRDRGILITSNPEAFQRRTWWRVDYDALNHLAETQNGNGENAKSKPPKAQTPKSEIASSTTLKEHKELKEVITPPSGANVVKAFVDAFVSLYNEQPDKQLIGRIGRDAKRMLSEGKELAILIASAEACAQSGHGNLPASYTQTITAGKRNAPRGFAGIREFLDDLNDAS
jgi:DNA-binding transcriptional ArsR family regulator